MTGYYFLWALCGVGIVCRGVLRACGGVRAVMLPQCAIVVVVCVWSDDGASKLVCAFARRATVLPLRLCVVACAWLYRLSL